jgi:hypothetical protein
MGEIMAVWMSADFACILKTQTDVVKRALPVATPWLKYDTPIN